MPLALAAPTLRVPSASRLSGTAPATALTVDETVEDTAPCPCPVPDGTLIFSTTLSIMLRSIFAFVLARSSALLADALARSPAPSTTCTAHNRTTRAVSGDWALIGTGVF
jgi:hypothetical protein